MKNLKFFYAIVIAFLIIGSSMVSPAWSKSLINQNGQGVAIKGYDPVAYFTMAKPVKGSAEFQYEWMGAKWRFSSARHRDLFKSNPEKYAPQYGGY